VHISFFEFHDANVFVTSSSGESPAIVEVVVKEGDVIGTVDSLTNLFGYFKAMYTCHSKLRYMA
jgi:hypothetical protein